MLGRHAYPYRVPLEIKRGAQRFRGRRSGALLPRGAGPPGDQALAALDESIELAERRLGPTHQLVAMSLRQRGQALWTLGRLDEVAEPLERALTIWDDPDPARWANRRSDAHLTLARVLWAQGRERPQALEHARTALRLLEPVVEPDDPSLVEVRAWLANPR